MRETERERRKRRLNAMHEQPSQYNGGVDLREASPHLPPKMELGKTLSGFGEG